MNNVCLYVTDPSLVGSKTLDNFQHVIRSYKPKSNADKAIGMTIELDKAVIDCNFIESEEIENHLNGLNGFISSHTKNQDDLYYALSRSYNVRMVIGCVINPGFDEQGAVLEFIKDFSNFLRAMVFHDNTLLDYDWKPLVSL